MWLNFIDSCSGLTPEQLYKYVVGAADRGCDPFKAGVSSAESLISFISRAVRLEKCWFCSSTIYPGHGVTFVRNDATVGCRRRRVIGKTRLYLSGNSAFWKRHVETRPPPLPSPAQVFKFCRSKCHKNFKLKRNPRKVKWTKAYRKLAGKDLSEDATFEMERKRNRPEKYDRELVHKAVGAIKKVTAIRAAREARLHATRKAAVRDIEKAADVKQLEQEIHLIRAPGALLKDKQGEEVLREKAEELAADEMQE